VAVPLADIRFFVTFPANSVPGAVGKIFSVTSLIDHAARSLIDIFGRYTGTGSLAASCIRLQDNPCNTLVLWLSFAQRKGSGEVRDVSGIVAPNRSPAGLRSAMGNRKGRHGDGAIRTGGDNRGKWHLGIATSLKQSLHKLSSHLAFGHPIFIAGNVASRAVSAISTAFFIANSSSWSLCMRSRVRVSPVGKNCA